MITQDVGTKFLNVKIMNFWDVTSCELVDVYEYLGGIYCFHLQDIKVNFKYYLYELKASKCHPPQLQKFSSVRFAGNCLPCSASNLTK
jgi:hypothetical protein